MRLDTKAEFTGPLSHGLGPICLRHATTKAIRELTEDAESFLFEKLRPVPSGVYEGTNLNGTRVQTTTGNYRRNISTQYKGLTSVISDNGVIYGPWLEGTSSRNISTGWKGYSTFRKADQEIEKRKKRVFEKHIRQLARRLNK